MEHLSSAMKQSYRRRNQESQQVQWRREKIQELCSKGHSQREIASILQVGLATANRDLSYLRNQAKENIKKYVNERLLEEYEKCLVGLTSILREAWNTAANTENEREKIQALSLAKECYTMKLELLTNATVVDDVIRFVSERTRLTSRSKVSEESKESEPDYNHDNEELEEEQEKDTGEAEEEGITTNQVFSMGPILNLLSLL